MNRDGKRRTTGCGLRYLDTGRWVPVAFDYYDNLFLLMMNSVRISSEIVIVQK